MSITASDQSTRSGDHKVVKQCYLFLCCHDEEMWALIWKGASEKSLKTCILVGVHLPKAGS
jgi:hypothetical protein